MEDTITISVAALLVLATVVPYFFRFRRSEKEAEKRFEQLKVTGLEAANSMHPHFNALECIACGGCVAACPEEGVLAVIDGKATLIHGAKCVGHGLCADACPVGAITMLMASPGRSADLPVLNEHLETNVKNMFIVGELGGLGLIKNAITQGRRAVEHIASRNPACNGGYDVTVIGAGPAGLAAALTAKKHKLNYLLLEQGDVGGTILQYPRRKIVMTSPVEIPLWGKIKLTEITKESLLELWQGILKKTELRINTNEKVTEIQRGGGHFQVTTTKKTYVSSHVILALGRRGTPRKLGVPGEERSKVVYRLIDAETYSNCDVLVVGGGDSAVEAAVGLALQGTNRVTISYRKPEFTRLKDRNLKHLEENVKMKKIDVIFNSDVKEILEHEVQLETPSGITTLRNNYVFIFAGGEMPFDFLKKVGVQFQTQVLQ